MSTREDLSFDEFDELVSPRPEETAFDAIVEQAISRRGFLGVMAAGAGTFVLGTSAFPSLAAGHSSLEFAEVAANSDDTITLPEGFRMLSVEEVSAARKRVLADPLRYREENWKPYPF